MTSKQSHRYTDEQKADAVLAVIRDGRRPPDVGKELGASEQTVYAWVAKARREGVTKSTPPKPKETPHMKKQRRRRLFNQQYQDTIAARVLDGEQLRAVSKEVGIHEGVVRGWVKRLRQVRQAAHARAGKRGTARADAVIATVGAATFMPPRAVFVVYSADWSAVGVFADELTALRFAVANNRLVREVMPPVENLRSAPPGE